MKFDKIIVDHFAGGGGASTGIEQALGVPVTIAINHDTNAIAMHEKNHPLTKHYCESVWEVNPMTACDGRKVGLMWLSPDCKHFSRAKGGKPVDKNVRGLAWIAVKWARAAKPDIIMLENVPEFQTWGRLDKNGRPHPKYKGEIFRKFVRHLQREGYSVKWQELKACDYGAPTIRKRFFLVARCDGKPIAFPTATHGENKIPYHAVAECIDWSFPTKSIFGRDRPLADNTIRRIIKGLDRFVIKTDKPFIAPFGVMINHTGKKYHSGFDLDKPFKTITTKVGDAIVFPHLIQYHTESTLNDVRGQVLTEPIRTVDTGGRYALALSNMFIYRKNMDCQPMTAPVCTMTVQPSHYEMRTYLEKADTSSDLGNWNVVRKLLNMHCGYSLADDEILLFEFDGIAYYINDIGMRMLEPKELYLAQGFPSDYIIDFDVKGKKYSKTAQIARCGNSVPPPFAKALIEANLPEYCNNKTQPSMENSVDDF